MPVGITSAPVSPKRLGTTIRRLREATGWTQQELAQRAELGQPYLSRLERGDQRNPSLAVVKRLARAFGVSIEELL